MRDIIDEKNKSDAAQSSIISRPDQEPDYEIFAEAMMTSGPYKSADTGLGEDACGLFLSRNYCFFWIADGTSESPILMDKHLGITFSCRMLAQDLGISFRRELIKLPDIRQSLDRKEPVIETLLKNTLVEVLEKWSNQLQEIITKNPVTLDEIFSDGLVISGY